MQVVDLPGAYSLTPATPDEQITLEVIEGRRHGEAAPDAIVAVVDATNLRMNLRLVLELTQLGKPLMVALNMADVARAEGLAIDVAKLSAELGCPVVETVAVRADGHAALLALLESRLGGEPATAAAPVATQTGQREGRSSADLQLEVRRILAIAAPRRVDGAPLPAPDRRRRHASGLGPRPARRRPLPDVPGGLLVGRGADGRDQGGDGRRRRVGLDAHGRRPAAEPARRRRDRRRRQRPRLPAADPDPLLSSSSCSRTPATCRAPRSCSTT